MGRGGFEAAGFARLLMGPSLMLPHIFYLSNGLVIFQVINWLGAHSSQFGYVRLSIVPQRDHAPAFNAIFRVITPIIYMLLLSACLYWSRLDYLTSQVWLVVLYHYVFRAGYNVALGRARLLNWNSLLFQSTASVGLALALNKTMISNRSLFLPKVDDLANQLWLLVIGFLYLIFNNLTLPTKATEQRKERYLERQYQMFKSQYGGIVQKVTSIERLEALIFAVMIFENFNRPNWARSIERGLFRTGSTKTLGIMQVATKERITDAESVVIGANKIEKDYNNIKKAVSELPEWFGERNLLNGILQKYNVKSWYAIEVIQIYDRLIEKYYPKAPRLLIPGTVERRKQPRSGR